MEQTARMIDVAATLQRFLFQRTSQALRSGGKVAVCQRFGAKTKVRSVGRGKSALPAQCRGFPYILFIIPDVQPCLFQVIYGSNARRSECE
jgi:hypothetical protein